MIAFFFGDPEDQRSSTGNRKKELALIPNSE